MEEPFHVPAVAKSERYAAFIGAPFFFAFAVLGIATGLSWWSLPFFAMAGANVWTGWRGLRLARRGVLFDAEGLGPAEDGERLWTLLWKDYGGFRRAATKPLERLRYPERDGYEILDRSGQPLFHYLPPQGGATTAHLTRAARTELRYHLPKGVEDPTMRGVRPPSRRNVVAGLAVAVVCGLGAKFALANPLSPFFGLGIPATFMSVGGVATATLEGISLRRWAKGWRPVEALPAPEEGPTTERHLMRHAQSPIHFREGCRYRTVDPERRRRELRERVLVSHTAWIGVVLAAQSGYGLFVEPHGWPLLVLGVLWWSAMAGFGFASGRNERTQLAAIDDVLWVHDGHLIVVRSEGEPLVLSLPAANDREALRRKSLFGVTDFWRLPDGTRYALDRTRLYEAPNDIGD